MGPHQRDIFQNAIPSSGESTLELAQGWRQNCEHGDQDEFFIRSSDVQLKLNEILVRLRKIENQLVLSNILQVPQKELYSVEEFAELVGLTPYTVREHCRLRRLNATKTESGRGGVKEWRIPHAELVRYRNLGLLPLRKD